MRIALTILATLTILSVSAQMSNQTQPPLIQKQGVDLHLQPPVNKTAPQYEDAVFGMLLFTGVMGAYVLSTSETNTALNGGLIIGYGFTVSMVTLAYGKAQKKKAPVDP